MSMTVKVAYTPVVASEAQERAWRDDGQGLNVHFDYRVGAMTEPVPMDAELIGPPVDDVVAWIGSVEQVTKLGEVTASNDGHPAWPGSMLHLADQAEQWYQPRPPGANGGIFQVLTVLFVRLNNGESRVLCAERAWLLGDDGGTIERLAP